MSCTCVPNLVLLPQNARFTHIWSLSGWARGKYDDNSPTLCTNFDYARINHMGTGVEGSIHSLNDVGLRVFFLVRLAPARIVTGSAGSL